MMGKYTSLGSSKPELVFPSETRTCSQLFIRRMQGSSPVQVVRVGRGNKALCWLRSTFCKLSDPGWAASVYSLVKGDRILIHFIMFWSWWNKLMYGKELGIGLDTSSSGLLCVCLLGEVFLGRLATHSDFTWAAPQWCVGFSGMSHNFCSLSAAWPISLIKACTWAQWSPWKPPELSFSASQMVRSP